MDHIKKDARSRDEENKARRVDFHGQFVHLAQMAHLEHLDKEAEVPMTVLGLTWVFTSRAQVDRYVQDGRPNMFGLMVAEKLDKLGKRDEEIFVRAFLRAAIRQDIATAWDGWKKRHGHPPVEIKKAGGPRPRQQTARPHRHPPVRFGQPMPKGE